MTIFPIATLAAVNAIEARDRLDPFDIFGVLIPKLAFDTEPQWRAEAVA